MIYSLLCIENSDVVIIINQEVQIDTGKVYLTFKLLKRRYRSSEDDEKLKRLDYFNHPYEDGNTIKLIDDTDKPKSLSLQSLATKFEAFDDGKSGRRGKRNAVERENKDELKTDFDPFDANVFKN